jgi:CubicO group peptidase (beta-lactamase class C family)
VRVDVTNLPGDVVGLVEPGFERVAERFARNLEPISSGGEGDVGAACAVWIDGEPVVDIWGGLAEQETATAPARPWERDTIVIVFSCTKGATAVCANQLIQDGRLDPDAPIAEYWPEFAANGKGAIPVKWALSHRAGLAAVDGDLTLDDVAAWDPVIEAIAAQAPSWEPGTVHGYHARSYGWIVGEVIRRVTGQSPGEYFASSVAAPLGLDFFIGVPEDVEPRVARLYPAVLTSEEKALADAVLADQSTLLGRVMSGPSRLFAYDDMWNTRRLRAAEMPSSNGHGDARSLARMYAACIGELDGVRLLSDETVERATVPLSEGTDCVIGQPLWLGLGFMLAPSFPPSVGPRTFGHAGAGGSTAGCDPDRGVAFAYVMNQMRLSLTEPDPRAAGLLDAIYESLDA